MTATRKYRQGLIDSRICVDCAGKPAEQDSILCVDCRAVRRERVKMSSVYGKRIKRHRKLDANAKHLNFLLRGDAHSKLVSMVGDDNKSSFIEKLILKEYETRKGEGVCTTSCTLNSAVS